MDTDPISIGQFSLGDAISCGAQIRFLGKEAADEPGFCQALLNCLQQRFVDDNGYVANVEERINLIEFEMMGVRQIFQLAGFVDVGRVFGEGEGLKFDDLKIAAGGAVRLIVPASNLVTSIDLGVSDEGPAVFVSLDYPW